MLVVLVKSFEWGVDFEMPGELGRSSGVFGQDVCHFAQHLNGAGCKITQIPHRRGDQIQRSGDRLGHALKNNRRTIPKNSVAPESSSSQSTSPAVETSIRC